MPTVTEADRELLEEAAELPGALYGARLYSMTALMALALQREVFEREIAAVRAQQRVQGGLVALLRRPGTHKRRVIVPVIALVITIAGLFLVRGWTPRVPSVEVVTTQLPPPGTMAGKRVADSIADVPTEVPVATDHLSSRALSKKMKVLRAREAILQKDVVAFPADERRRTALAVHPADLPGAEQMASTQRTSAARQTPASDALVATNPASRRALSRGEVGREREAIGQESAVTLPADESRRTALAAYSADMPGVEQMAFTQRTSAGRRAPVAVAISTDEQPSDRRKRQVALDALRSLRRQ